MFMNLRLNSIEFQGIPGKMSMPCFFVFFLNKQTHNKLTWNSMFLGNPWSSLEFPGSLESNVSVHVDFKEVLVGWTVGQISTCDQVYFRMPMRLFFGFLKITT